MEFFGGAENKSPHIQEKMQRVLKVRFLNIPLSAFFAFSFSDK